MIKRSSYFILGTIHKRCRKLFADFWNPPTTYWHFYTYQLANSYHYLLPPLNLPTDECKKCQLVVRKVSIVSKQFPTSFMDGPKYVLIFVKIGDNYSTWCINLYYSNNITNWQKKIYLHEKLHIRLDSAWTNTSLTSIL